MKYILLLLLIYSSLEQNQNSPQTVVGSIPKTTQNYTNFYEPKLFLLGFGNYKQQSQTAIIFNIFFKKYLIYNVPRIIRIVVEIFYSSRRFRFLDEQKSYVVNCTLTSDDENILDYACPVNDIENLTVKSVSVPLDKIDVGDNTMVSTNLAKETFQKINEQVGYEAKKDINIFNVTDVDRDSLPGSFIIKGTAEKTISDNKLIFSVYENGEEKTINCDVELNDKEKKKYILTCKPSTIIKADLNDAEGKGESNEVILLQFPKGINGTIDNDPNIQIKHRKKSSGLSAGGIAGIIIACVAVLIAVGIATALCRSSPKPPMQPIEIMTSTSNTQGFNPNSSYNVK